MGGRVGRGVSTGSVNLNLQTCETHNLIPSETDGPFSSPRGRSELQPELTFPLLGSAPNPLGNSGPDSAPSARSAGGGEALRVTPSGFRAWEERGRRMGSTLIRSTSFAKSPPLLAAGGFFFAASVSLFSLLLLGPIENKVPLQLYEHPISSLNFQIIKQLFCFHPLGSTSVIGAPSKPRNLGCSWGRVSEVCCWVWHSQQESQ